MTEYRLEFVFESPKEKTQLVAQHREFSMSGDTLAVDPEHGVLNYVNRVDMYGHADEVPREELTAHLGRQPWNGHVELNEDHGKWNVSILWGGVGPFRGVDDSLDTAYRHALDALIISGHSTPGIHDLAAQITPGQFEP